MFVLSSVFSLLGLPLKGQAGSYEQVARHWFSYMKLSTKIKYSEDCLVFQSQSQVSLRRSQKRFLNSLLLLVPLMAVPSFFPEPFEEGRSGIHFSKTSITWSNCLSKVCLFVLSWCFELINDKPLNKVKSRKNDLTIGSITSL